jgi:hypothetical protein
MAMRKNPKIPASWYTAKGALIGTALAVAGAWVAVRVGGISAFAIGVPFVACAASVPIIVFFDWALGRGQRAYRFGTGRQDIWGYQGHDIRGLVDDGKTWVSLGDCEMASGLDLSTGLKTIPMSRRRLDDVKGLVLDMPSMIKVLDACGQDFAKVNRLRMFLERTVWKVRRG